MFNPISNINSTIKNMEMKKKAELRLANIQRFTAELNDPKRILAVQTGLIADKLRRGDELSPSDMEHLRQNNPQLYAKAVQVQRERKEYAEQLRRCKTKEEARSLHLQKTAMLGGAVKSTAQGGSVEYDTMGYHFAAAENEFRQFLRTPLYRKLPETYEDRRKKTDQFVGRTDRRKSK